MKTSNGHIVINGNKRQKIIGNVLSNSTKRNQKKLRRSLSPEPDEYPENQLSPEYLTEEELEEEEEEEGQNDVIESIKSTMRPLLQLFSEELRSPTKPSSGVAVKQQIVYKNISLSSEEEVEEDTEPEPDAFDAEELIPVHREYVQPRLSMATRFKWSPKSTNIFLDLWEKSLADLRGNRRNSDIHKEMAEELKDYGFSAKEIKSKMDNMTRKYKTEARKIKDGTSTTWRYFKRIKSFLVDTTGADFEEIIFENTESSPFFNGDSSGSEGKINDVSAEDLIQKELEEEAEQAEVDEIEGEEEQVRGKDQPPPVKTPPKEEDKAKVRTEPNDRMLQIEEEKLIVEKEKLQVLKHISRDLASMNRTLIEVLRNTKNK